MLALRFLPRISRVRSLALAGLEYSMRAMDHLRFLFIGLACQKRHAKRVIMPCARRRINVWRPAKLGTWSDPARRLPTHEAVQIHGAKRARTSKCWAAVLTNVTARAQVGYL